MSEPRRSGSAPGPELVTPRFRRPTENDYAALAGLVDEWWDGRVVQGLLPRLWFRHFADKSWIAEAGDGATTGPGMAAAQPRIAGFLVGFLSPGQPGSAVLHAVGVHPTARRQNLGRLLVDHFLADARQAGALRVEAVLWPGNRRGLAFLAALGFGPDPDPAARPIYGIPAIEGYDFGTEDRARYGREL
ncbi:MAG: GNAT family N-acetyltransferase [Candidatus Limnocylindrales bacterium]